MGNLAGSLSLGLLGKLNVWCISQGGQPRDSGQTTRASLKIPKVMQLPVKTTSVKNYTGMKKRVFIPPPQYTAYLKYNRIWIGFALHKGHETHTNKKNDF